MNIEQAKQLEEQYLKLPPKEANEFKLKEKLECLGYDFETYHNDKEKDTLTKTITNIKFKEIEMQNLHLEEDKVIKDGEEKILFVAPKEEWVFGNYNQEEIPTGINYMYLGHACRNIITGKNNVNFAVIVKQKSVLSFYMEWFKNKVKELGVKIIDLIGVEMIKEDYSIYYIQIYLTEEERIKLLTLWLK